MAEEEQHGVINTTKNFAVIGGCYGLYKATFDSMQYPQPPFTKFLKTLGTSTVVPAVAAAGFALGNQGMKNIRSCDDNWNYLGGSAISGAIIGTFLRSTPAVFGATACIFGVSVVYELSGGLRVPNDEREKKVIQLRSA